MGTIFARLAYSACWKYGVTSSKASCLDSMDHGSRFNKGLYGTKCHELCNAGGASDTD